MRILAMKKSAIFIALMVVAILMAGCSNQNTKVITEHYKYDNLYRYVLEEEVII